MPEAQLPPIDLDPGLNPAPARDILPPGTRFRVAATSFTLPDRVGNNCAWLSQFFPEVGLALFETEACLAYDENDLPRSLADLPLSYHAHLPLDLPWTRGVDAVWEAVSGLLERVAYLRPWAYVLHPPLEAGSVPGLARRFSAAGINPAAVLLENIQGNDLTAIWPAVLDSGFGVCLDLGHALAYGQRALMDLPGLWERVAMLHVYSPGPRGRHQSLDGLGQDGRGLLRAWLGRLSPGRTVTIEVFDPQGLFISLRTLAGWLNSWRDLNR
ncbi:MAG: hypothetical protein JW718_03830 [Desulfovibrionaceae bacterium]|nr:hypothetical protein [Desulfovibrionaceae bacterium]